MAAQRTLSEILSLHIALLISFMGPQFFAILLSIVPPNFSNSYISIVTL